MNAIPLKEKKIFANVYNNVQNVETGGTKPLVRFSLFFI